MGHRLLAALGLLGLLASPAVAQPIEVLMTAEGAGPTGPLDWPLGLARTTDGSLWVTGHYSLNLLRKAPDGTVTEVYDRWPSFSQLGGLAVADDGTIFGTIHGSDVILQIDTQGDVEVVTDQQATPLDGPRELAVAPDGSLLILGRFSNNLVRADASFDLTVILDASGAGPGQELDQPGDLAVDGAGNAFVAGLASDNVLKVTPAGVISEVLGPAGDGAGHPLNGASSVVLADDGTLYVSSMFEHCVLRVAPGGQVDVVLDEDGAGPGQPLSLPGELALAADGTLYVVSRGNDRVFAVAPGGAVSQALDVSGDGLGHTADDPIDLLPHPAGGVYVACVVSETLFHLDGGSVTHVADLPGYADLPYSGGDGALALDLQDRLLVASWKANTIERFETDGSATVLAESGGGTGSQFFNLDTVLVDDQDRVHVQADKAVYRFDGPGSDPVMVLDPEGSGTGAPVLALRDMILDAQGRVVISDREGERLLRIEADDSVSVLASAATSPLVDKPSEMVLTPDGSLLFDSNAPADIVALRPDGTLESLLTWNDVHPGISPTGTAGFPDLAVDPLGRVFATDAKYTQLLRLDADGSFEVLWSETNNGSPYDVAVEPDGTVWLSARLVNEHLVMTFSPSGEVITRLDGSGDGLGELFGNGQSLVADGPGRMLVVGSTTDNIFALDRELCGAFTLLPGAGAADGSDPLLFGEGDLCAGSDWLVGLRGGRPNAAGLMVLGYGELSAPFQGQLLIPVPDLLLPIVTDGDGATDLAGSWPAGVPAGASAWLQAWIPEPPGQAGYRASNGLRLDTLD